MCAALNHVPPTPPPCPCAALTRDTTQWCNRCWLQLHDLERNVTLELPREYTLQDVLVAALREQAIAAFTATPTTAA
jgi:hypothetical protein